MKNSLRTAAFATALAASAIPAAIAQPAAPDVKSGTFKLDPSHTQIVFAVSHFGFTNYRGVFSGASGALQLDVGHPSGSKLDVSLPVDSLFTTVQRLTDQLKSPQWFDAAHFPTAQFTSTKVEQVGKDAAVVTGNFTLHGITKSVKLNVRFVGAGVNPLNKAYTVGFEATGTIKRSEFGIATFIPMVSDEVNLTVSGAFEQQG